MRGSKYCTLKLVKYQGGTCIGSAWINPVFRFSEFQKCNMKVNNVLSVDFIRTDLPIRALPDGIATAVSVATH